MIEEWEKTLDSLQHFAADGLRTLVCGYKELDERDYVDWLDRLTKHNRVWRIGISKSRLCMKRLKMN